MEKIHIKSLSTVESCTGGLFASTITSQSGVSDFFKGGLITYTNEVKKNFNIKIKDGAVSAQTAQAMSQKGNELFQSDLCVAFTGVAGPTTVENKPVGLVYIAFNNVVYQKQFSGTRNQIRLQAVEFAINKIKTNYLIIKQSKIGV